MSYSIYTSREPVKRYFGRVMEIADGSYEAGEVYILAENPEEALGLLASWASDVEWFWDNPENPEEETLELRLYVYETDDNGDYDILSPAGVAEVKYEYGSWWLKGADWLKYEVLKHPKHIVIQKVRV